MGVCMYYVFIDNKIHILASLFTDIFINGICTERKRCDHIVIAFLQKYG